LAVYRPKYWGEEWVEYVKGRRFCWKSTSLWGAGRGFYNDHKELLFVLKPKFFDLLKIQYAVKVEAQYADLDELPLLLMLACYLSVLNSYAGR
jgi:hypothetical protein